jgi:hypothetical protein
LVPSAARLTTQRWRAFLVPLEEELRKVLEVQASGTVAVAAAEQTPTACRMSLQLSKARRVCLHNPMEGPARQRTPRAQRRRLQTSMAQLRRMWASRAQQRCLLTSKVLEEQEAQPARQPHPAVLGLLTSPTGRQPRRTICGCAMDLSS